MIQRLFILSLLIALACGCSGGKKTYRIGVDPSWYPLRLMGKEANVFAFTNDLLQEIAKEENIHFERINMSWDHLTQGLQDGTYDGMLSSIYPYVFNLSTYDFSEVFLQTGPVLVVKNGVNIKGKMTGKEIAVSSQADEALLIRTYPDVTVRYYAQIPEGINDLIADMYDGMLIDNLIATSFVQDLYQGAIEVRTEPLNDAGLRMLTLHRTHDELIARFNRGLEKVRDRAIYKELLKKWDLL